MSDLFTPEQLAQAGSQPAPKQSAPSRKRRGAPAPARPAPPELDPRIYGLARPASGECLNHLRDHMSEQEFGRWKLRNLPLSAPLTAEDLTPQGQVKILRRRGYADAEIRLTFPALAEYVDQAG